MVRTEQKEEEGEEEEEEEEEEGRRRRAGGSALVLMGPRAKILVSAAAKRGVKAHCLLRLLFKRAKAGLLGTELDSAAKILTYTVVEPRS